MTFETLRGSGPAAAVLGRGAPPVGGAALCPPGLRRAHPLSKPPWHAGASWGRLCRRLSPVVFLRIPRGAGAGRGVRRARHLPLGSAWSTHVPPSLLP